MSEPEYHYDTSIVEELKLIASKELQLEYRKSVPIADVPAELVCGWFDDLYHPELEGFRRCFSQRELEALREFNIFYDERIDRLPDSFLGLVALHDSPIWQEIMGKAGETLSVLEQTRTSEQSNAG